jgi:hypothetical protein
VLATKKEFSEDTPCIGSCIGSYTKPFSIEYRFAMGKDGDQT